MCRSGVASVQVNVMLIVLFNCFHTILQLDLKKQMAVQVNVTLIVLFNYYYTFLQLDPKDMADQLKRAGGAIPAVRPGRATADYITKTLNRMSILGSAFLGALAAAPSPGRGCHRASGQAACHLCCQLHICKMCDAVCCLRPVPGLTWHGCATFCTVDHMHCVMPAQACRGACAVIPM